MALKGQKRKQFFCVFKIWPYRTIELLIKRFCNTLLVKSTILNHICCCCVIVCKFDFSYLKLCFKFHCIYAQSTWLRCKMFIYRNQWPRATKDLRPELEKTVNNFYLEKTKKLLLVLARIFTSIAIAMHLFRVHVSNRRMSAYTHIHMPY